jgi:outer membrane receptor protein involved in Fe transport
MVSFPVSRAVPCARLVRVPRNLVLATVAGASAITAVTAFAADAERTLEEIVVTATRRAEPALRTPVSIGRIPEADVLLVGSTHHSEILNRVAGAMIQRGSGQESLTAIRSPVLTGAGSCGAFLFLENSVPIRPVGFCNVNELFEVNTEQADAIEVLRGPATALYGSNAVHGTVNVVEAAPADRRAIRASVEGGPDDYARAKFEGRTLGQRADFGLKALYTHDGGWRDDSGFDEVKLNATLVTSIADLAARFDLSATDLDQETAGFITGESAYRDDDIARSNPNPEAYRDARAVRLTGLVEAEAGSARLEFRPYLRSSRMEFLQHFLLGKPLERNGQESAGLMSQARWSASDEWSVNAGLDLEYADSFLVEDQDGPTTDGPPPANAVRPAGLHYDYDVRSYVAAAYLQGDRRLRERWRVQAGLRAEYVDYDYDNRMLAGNTDENGVPCEPDGCLYTRPADRSDDFFNVAPKLSISYDIAEGAVAYASVSRGFRPPEITELYRLQRGQQVADLDSERLDAIELGIKAQYATWRAALAAFDMDKSDVILRDSLGFNVSNGKTSHQGVEYELTWAPLAAVELGAAGTFARHRYEFSRLIEQGETITEGDDVDTAPRQLHTFWLRWRPAVGLTTEAEWLVVGDYFVDASNSNRYPGHELLNLRARWQFAENWSLAARLNNALDRAYADRADFAFGTYRYFPGRGRAAFVEVAWQR